MAFNFRAKAMEELTLSDLMKDREKLETEQLIELHEKDGVTIEDFDVFTMTKNDKEEEICCFIVKEEPNHFIFGGKIIKGIFESFIKSYNGDVESCRYDFKNSGGLKVKFSRGKTKDGKQITKIKII